MRNFSQSISKLFWSTDNIPQKAKKKYTHFVMYAYKNIGESNLYYKIF